MVLVSIVDPLHFRLHNKCVACMCAASLGSLVSVRSAPLLPVRLLWEVLPHPATPGSRQ